MKHLLDNKLVSSHQHGFLSGRSCVTHLLEVLDEWTEVLEEGGSVDAIYMDFKKAFDAVPHSRLLSKLSALGLSGEILKWVEAFLSGRTQRVVVNGVKSSAAKVTSGIPQGSVLGPVLFIMYNNDLPKVVSNSVKLFADDTKLYARSDSQDQTDSVQTDLNSLCQWSRDWLLSFHPEKCSVLKLGSKKSLAQYHMSSSVSAEVHTLSETEVEKDLGVLVDNKLNFKQHVASAVSKANRVLGVIRRSFHHLDNSTFVQLYKSMVRPILEYGQSAWQPSLKGLRQDLENVQRRATRLLGNLKEMTYEERLKTLRLPSLEHRRRRGDMIDVFKYVRGLYDTSRPHLKPAPVEQDTRGNSLKLYKDFAGSSVRKAFFSERVVADWNSLPDTVVTAPSVNAFKARLDTFWANAETLYCPPCFVAFS